MERVYTDYTASGRQIVLNNVPSSFASITVENVRLIFNETQKDSNGDAIDPLVSTGKKENLSSIVYNGTAHTVTLVLANNVPEIVSTDDLTIKIDMGDSVDGLAKTSDLPTDYAKQGSSATVTLTGVDGKIGDLSDIIEAINGDTVDNIVAMYLDGEAEDIEAIIGDWSDINS